MTVSPRTTGSDEQFPEPPPPARPSELTEADWAYRKSLLEERNGLVAQVRGGEELARILLRFRSYAERAQVYCEHQLGHGPFGRNSLGKLEMEYQTLLRAEPDTSEGERLRQMKLLVVKQTMAAYLRDIRTCQGLLVSGGQELHTNEQIRETINSQKTRIAEIDQQLALTVNEHFR